MMLYFRVDRTSDDNREKEYLAHHRCEAGDRLARQGKSDADVLVFYPHVYMVGMPTGIPTPVQSEDECGACGAFVTAMFEFKSNLLFL